MTKPLSDNVRPTLPERGFALIVTLIMVALAAVIVVALLVNASMERTTAASYANRFNAELAVQNGLEAAKKALVASPTAGQSSLTLSDNFLVIRVDAPAMPINPAPAVTTAAYYYLAQARSGAANVIDYYPLFSGGSPVLGQTINLAPGAPQPAVTRPTPPPDPNPSSPGSAAIETDGAGNQITKSYPTVGPWLGPPSTNWVTIHDPEETATSPPFDYPYQRYAFWAEDLAGYLDARIVGNEHGSGTHLRANGTNPNEIALFTVFAPNASVDPGNTGAHDILFRRTALFTMPTIKEIVGANAGPDVVSANLAVRLGLDDGGEQNVIPRGYGYPNEGQPKTDLNALIASKNVSGIATAITTALPQFSSRAGGNAFDYARNLAANIIDYADPTNAPTTDGATYRGLGAFPLVISAFDLNNWIAVTGGPPNDYQVQIEVTTYVQLWNPHNIRTTGNFSLHYENVDALQVNTNTVHYTPPTDINLANFSMEPNEYRVIVYPAKIYTFDWGPTPPATTGPTASQSSIPFPTATTANGVQLRWNAKLADRQNKNLQRPVAPTGMRYNPNRNATNAYWRGNAAPPIYPLTGGSGDPRASFYGNRPWTVASYDNNSCWGGRLQLGRPTVIAEMQPTSWPDGGHDSTPGTKATGNAVKPDVLAAMTPIVQADADKWVSRLSTRGSLESLTELGNVFDIGQWNYPLPSTNSLTNLPDIPLSATADTTLGAGGGYTLAVGRPEFSKFDVNGQRAWQLLDIFSLGARTESSGTVNVNTASFEALRALAASILLDQDRAISFSPNPPPPSGLYPPTANAPTTSEAQPPARNDGGQANLFAEAVIQSRPFLSAGQMQTALTIPPTRAQPEPFFGNPNQWGDVTPPTEWNDPGREELFAKILNLAAVRSRNFRVFVTGQSLDKNGRVLSTLTKVFQVFLKPQRAANGAVLSQLVEIRYETSL